MSSIKFFLLCNKPFNSFPASDDFIFSLLVSTKFQLLVKTNIPKYKSKKGGKDQEGIQSSSTPDPGYHMGK